VYLSRSPSSLAATRPSQILRRGSGYGISAVKICEDSELKYNLRNLPMRYTNEI
jgi:hypothetical protein